MDKVNGFKKYKRQVPKVESSDKRILHFKEFEQPASSTLVAEQSARCMDCGVPFCHSACPLGNNIPDFNDAVYRESWQEAYEILASTNNFPEFTGRICPAPCEGSCVLGINNDPVTIEYIEKEVAEKAFKNGWVDLKSTVQKTGKKIAIIGSGPSGLACAEELNANGHQVDVYEKADRIGGLLRYGIPDFKLEKRIVDRRINLMREAGIDFFTNVAFGTDIMPQELANTYDAVVLCIGSSKPRDLDIEGRHLTGVHYAMDFLTKANKHVAGDNIEPIPCEGKDILVIGGGDTGSDCIGTSNRLGAKSVTQLELMTKPPTTRDADNPWPQWPMTLRTSSSHKEGASREWCVSTKRFLSEDGVHLSGVETVRVEWSKGVDGRYKMEEVSGTETIIPCQLAFLAIGFTQPILSGNLSKLGLDLDSRRNIWTKNYQTSIPNIFAAGDARMGQSLVVHAIAEGRKVALAVEECIGVSKTAAFNKIGRHPLEV